MLPEFPPVVIFDNEILPLIPLTEESVETVEAAQDGPVVEAAKDAPVAKHQEDQTEEVHILCNKI